MPTSEPPADGRQAAPDAAPSDRAPAEQTPSEQAPSEHAPPTRALPVRAEGLSLRGARGWVFRDVALDVPAGGLVALTGIAGSGRTALLLSLSGRMKPTSGTATVGDLALPADLRAVQRVTALGAVTGVTDLDPALSVREHVSEALDLREGVFGRWRGRSARIRRALDEVGLGDLDPKALAEELDPDQAQLLGAALGLVGRPGVLMLDDVDEGLPLDRQRALWQRLRAIADSGVTVLATCHDSAPADGLAQRVELPDPRAALSDAPSTTPAEEEPR
ncbi:ATP-binding cassette domain-containing protein [Actinomadura hibisca]|uniref:ATP-binding cassette domain-containing protein n=1 Tax=Actinomadura hibisca TaxID=68565 RepID=UPI000B2E2F30|nr:ATP-binding cassette domain-containing protein [Actinomadura hibisca]